MSSKLARDALNAYACEKHAKSQQRFFKTGEGDYAEHDVFIGVKNPDIRAVAKDFKNLPIEDIKELLNSRIHEERFLALAIMNLQYIDRPEEIYNFYMENIAYVNNWDLVDISAHYIIGRHLIKANRNILYRLAKSKNIWERRIAIVATWWFIRKNDLWDTFGIAETLLMDKHDLIRKAVGWMLREAGKRDETLLRSFLDKNYIVMPRIMTRYAIERLGEGASKKYLGKHVKI